MGNKYTKGSLNKICSTRKKKVLIMTKPELNSEGLNLLTSKNLQAVTSFREERVVPVVGFADS